MVEKYGPFVWKTYCGLYFGTLGGAFLGVQWGVLGVQWGVMNPLLQWVAGKSGRPFSTPVEFAVNFLHSHRRLARYAVRVQSNPWAANLVLAFLITEATEPLRIACTGALVPILAKRNTHG
jgi:hypothetical protein